MLVNLKMVIKNIRKKYMNEIDESLIEDSSSSEDSDDYGHSLEEQKISRRTSSIGFERKSTGFARSIAKMAEGDDLEDYKQTQKISLESKRKHINKPKVMNVNRANNSPNHEQNLFSENE
jgi:hypothetical protein